MKTSLISAHESQSPCRPARVRHGLALLEAEPERPRSSEIVGQSAALCKVLRQLERVAPTDSAVLIQGETGTGKELIAKAIHEGSPRRNAAFVKVNVAAIPTSLLESELFGYERGAFTGAFTRRVGRFEQAQNGTIFLDEIGELNPELQPKLLRLIQEREFQRLGGSQTLSCDVRLIAATNRDLHSLVEAQRFRADLFYRLNVFPIHAPPLRDRSGDIPLLVEHLVRQISRRMAKPVGALSAETTRKLERYAWPGNIRELQNVLERAIIMSNGAELEVELEERASSERTEPLDAITRAHILRVLEECRWVIGGPRGAALKLGLKRTTLNARMKRLGIGRI